MQFKITSDGLAAAFAASNQGPVIKIARFRIGSAFGYEPALTDKSLRGTELYVGTPSGYRTISDSECEFTLLADENQGTWQFGEVGIYLESGKLFALASLTLPMYKVAYPDKDFNRFSVRVRLSLAEAIPKIELVVDGSVAGKIWELPSVELLPLPDVSPTNVYLCQSQDQDGNSALCTLGDNKQWTITSHMRRKVVGTVLTVNESGTGITSAATYNVSDVSAGRYLIQVTSGPNSGQVRRISTMSNGSYGWVMPLSIDVGDSFEILQSSGEYENSEDAAFFYAILGANI